MDGRRGREGRRVDVSAADRRWPVPLFADGLHPSGQVRPPGPRGLRQQGSALRARLLSPGLKARTFAVLLLCRSFWAGFGCWWWLGDGFGGCSHSSQKWACMAQVSHWEIPLLHAGKRKVAPAVCRVELGESKGEGQNETPEGRRGVYASV